MNLREQILAAKDRPTEAVEVPEWGVTVHVATMSGRARDLWEADIIERRKAADYETRMGDVRASLIARCVVDEQGKRIFSEADIAALGEKSSAALDRLFAVAMRLNALSQNDAEALAKK